MLSGKRRKNFLGRSFIPPFSASLTKYSIVLSYLGTCYQGWQKQPGGKATLSATVEAVLQRLTGEDVRVIASGRTDSGVHATGQVAHFVLKERPWDSGILFRGMNSLFPPDIRCLSIERVPLEFHAQRGAERKQYSYYFQQGPCALPHLLPFSWWTGPRLLDSYAMLEAVLFLVGEHDFKPFQASGGNSGRSSIRRIEIATVESFPIVFPSKINPSFFLIQVRLVGSGFLKQMVRGIVGTLYQIGKGRYPSTRIRDILESGQRSQVGPTAPPQGLWLERVEY